MSKIELERKRLELKRVMMAQEEMEFNIMEREADIERLRMNIDLQKKKALEIAEQLKQMGEAK